MPEKYRKIRDAFREKQVAMMARGAAIKAASAKLAAMRDSAVIQYKAYVKDGNNFKLIGQSK